MKIKLGKTGIFICSLGGALILIAMLLNISTNRRFEKTYKVEIPELVIPTDSKSLARGKHLSKVIGCEQCHGADLSGKVFIDDPVAGTIYSSNLTSGIGGVGATFTNMDFVRAIRHGVKPDGKPSILIPSQDFYYFTDTDLGALIQYIRTIPAVDNSLPQPAFPFMGRILMALGVFGNAVIPAEIIDHAAPRPLDPERKDLVAMGKYQIQLGGCSTCHGSALTGMNNPPMPGSPPANNITQTGNLGEWSEAGFITTMRTGVTPSGNVLDPRFMPWIPLSQLHDQELHEIWSYLRSIRAADE